jgi:hypothetical protein
LGAKVHPASGALRIKNDASTDSTLYEIKDANKTHTIKATEVMSLWKEAVISDREAVYLIKFPDFTLYCYPVKGKDHE